MTKEMMQYTSTVLWFSTIILPYLIFIVHNRFQSTIATIFRAFVAIGTGWLQIVAYAIAANALNMAILSIDQENNAIVNGDGAKLSFSVLFGWLIPSGVVFISWFIHSKLGRKVK